MVQTRLHKHSLSKAEQAVSNVASRASVRDPIDEFQEVYGSRAASADFRQQLGSDFSQSGQFQPPIQAKPSFRGLSQELAPIQAKLTVGPANDKYEQEADRVAAQVVQRIHAPVSNSSAQVESVQRREEEDELQLKPIAPIQRKEMSEGGEVSSDLESEINRARGGGQALAPEMRLKMGEAMGADFSGVRVHTDGRADALNQSVGARAFTTGQDLFFKRGDYEPGSRGGQELIAHELTHVVQQGERYSKSIQRNGDEKKEGENVIDATKITPLGRGSSSKTAFKVSGEEQYLFVTIPETKRAELELELNLYERLAHVGVRIPRIEKTIYKTTYDGISRIGVMMEKLVGTEYKQTLTWVFVNKQVQQWKDQDDYSEKLNNLKRTIDTFIKAKAHVDDLQVFIIDQTGEMIVFDPNAVSITPQDNPKYPELETISNKLSTLIENLNKSVER